MSREIPEKITTKGGHRPRARIHAGWSPIGQRLRRNAMLRVVGVVLALLIMVGLAADAYAQSFFDSLPSIQGLDSAVFAGGGLKIVYDLALYTGFHNRRADHER